MDQKYSTKKVLDTVKRIECNEQFKHFLLGRIGKKQDSLVKMLPDDVLCLVWKELIKSDGYFLFDEIINVEVVKRRERGKNQKIFLITCKRDSDTKIYEYWIDKWVEFECINMNLRDSHLVMDFYMKETDVAEEIYNHFNTNKGIFDISK